MQITQTDDVAMIETNEADQGQHPLQVDEEYSEESQIGQDHLRIKRVYIRASNVQRLKLINLVNKQKIKIRKAAEMTGIGYENAKQILKVFKREGRKLTLLFKNKNIQAG